MSASTSRRTGTTLLTSGLLSTSVSVTNAGPGPALLSNGTQLAAAGSTTVSNSSGLKVTVPAGTYADITVDPGSDSIAAQPAASALTPSGDTTGATDTAAIAAALTGLSNGGVLTLQPGTYYGTISVTANKRIVVQGYGATLKAAANSATLVTVNQGYGNGIAGAVVAGLVLDGNGKTGVTGFALQDTDGSVGRHLWAKNCATGFKFDSHSSGGWVERCSIDESFVSACTTGIAFVKASGTGSMNESALNDVGVSSCGVGISCGAGTDFTRTTWRNVTVWVTLGQTGVQFAGRLDFSRLQFGVESLDAGTGTTGVLVDTTYTNYSDPYGHTVEVSFVGTFATKIVDNSTGGFGVVLRNGSNVVSTAYGPALLARHLGDTYDRVKIGAAGIEVGPGNAATVQLAQNFYGNFFRNYTNMLFQTAPGFPAAAANGGSAASAVHIYGTDDSYAGYLPVYSTSDGPAVRLSNAQTGTTYTLVAGDAGKVVTMTNASANTLTVPTNASVAFTIGTEIEIEQLGAGQTTIAAAGGVTVSSLGGLLHITGQYGKVKLRKTATNVWLLSGSLS